MALQIHIYICVTPSYLMEVIPSQSPFPTPLYNYIEYDCVYPWQEHINPTSWSTYKKGRITQFINRRETIEQVIPMYYLFSLAPSQFPILIPLIFLLLFNLLLARLKTTTQGVY